MGFLRAFPAALAVAVLWPASAGAATIDVDTTSDELNADADCSLREAVQAANTNDPVSGCIAGEGGSKLDTIRLEGEEYGFSLGPADEDDNAGGDLDYTGGGKLAIKGTDQDETELESDQTDRVLHATGNASSLTLQRLSIETGDVSSYDGGGGNLMVDEGKLRLIRSRVLSGEAQGAALSFGSGGGVRVVSGRPVLIDRTLLAGNDARFGGALSLSGEGELTIKRSEFLGNEAATGASRGGAITTSADQTTITDTTFADNSTESDGGGSALGGAIYGGDNIVIRRSLFAGNEALGEDLVEPRGGALALLGESIKVANSTFFDNTSGYEGGAVHGDVSVSHSTFFANEAGAVGDHVNGGATVRNSILPGASIAVDLCGPDVTSKGFNVMTYDDANCGTLDSDLIAPGDIGFVDPDAPADNGGPTDTLAIEGSSPAKDLIPKGKCKVARGEDQRGFARPKGKRCDAGAFERGAQPKVIESTLQGSTAH